jgi:ubiquitin C-terminal hydrolase
LFFLLLGGWIDFKFQKSLKDVNNHNRFDQGKFNMFNSSEISNFIDRNNQCHLKVKLVVQEVFSPRKPSFHYNSKESTGMVGLENLGATCYLNSLLQMLFHLNSFRHAVYQIPYEKEEFKSSTTLALQNVFNNLQTSKHEVTTKELTTAFGWTSLEAFMQQDVQEMMRVLIDKLEEKMKGTAVDGYAKELFCGKARSYIRCINVEYESSREEEFYDISLDVKGCKNIMESFDKYIAIEVLDGDNQYDSGQFGKQDAKKGVIFTKFPPVLTIQLKRFDFDLRVMGFRKIHDYFEFPLRLNLQKYLATDSNSQQQNDEDDCTYLLHSVLVHSGDVGGGHYYAYIRPSTDHNYKTVYNTNQLMTAMKDKDLEWYKFNDENVLSVTQFEATEYCYGRRPPSEQMDGNVNANLFKDIMSSAYMLVYIREKDAPAIMKPLPIDEDIPAGLNQRLVTERQLKILEERKLQQLKMFVNIGYIRETDISNFGNYTRNSGFIDDPSFKRRKIMVDSFPLGVLLDISDDIQVPPNMLRLWKIDKLKDCITMGENIPMDSLTKTKLKEKYQRFFIEELPYPPNFFEASEVESFADEYEQLRNQEKEWLTKLKESLLKNVLILSTFYGDGQQQQQEELTTMDAEEAAEGEETVSGNSSPIKSKSLNSLAGKGNSDELVHGCGIGKSNKPLEDLKQYNLELFQELRNEMRALNSRMVELLQNHSPDSSEQGTEEEPEKESRHRHQHHHHHKKEVEEETKLETRAEETKEGEKATEEDDEDQGNENDLGLLFIKIYDPLDFLPTLSNSYPVVISPDNDSKNYDTFDYQPYEDAIFLTKKVKRSYNPMKYLGFSPIHLNEPIMGVHLIFQELLKEKVFHEKFESRENTQIQECCKHFNFYKFYGMDSPSEMKEIEFDANTPFNQHFYEGGGVCVATFNDLFYEQCNVDLTTVKTSPALYFKSKFQNRTLLLSPLDNREECRTLYYAKKYHLLMKEERASSESASSGIESNISGKKRNHDDDGELQQQSSPKKGAVNHRPSEDEEEPGYFTMETEEAPSPTHRSPPLQQQHLSEPLKIVAGLEMEFSLVEGSIATLVKKVADELAVDPTHLILYFEPYHEGSRPVHDTVPWTVHYEEKFSQFLVNEIQNHRERELQQMHQQRFNRNIINLTQDSKTNFVKLSKYHVYYRISPEPVSIPSPSHLGGSEKFTAARESYSTFEIFITDERLRKFRKLFLQHSIDQVHPNFKELLFELEDGNMNTSQPNLHSSSSGGISNNHKKQKLDDRNDSNLSLSRLNTIDDPVHHHHGGQKGSVPSSFIEFIDQVQLDYVHPYHWKPYQCPESNKIVYQIAKSASAQDLLNKLRINVFGIPLNISEILKSLKQFYYESIEGHPEKLQETEKELNEYVSWTKEHYRLMTSTQLFDSQWNVLGVNLCTDKISIQTDDNRNNNNNEHHNNNSPNSHHFHFSPDFPLTLGVIEDNRLVNIFFPSVKLEKIPANSW